MQTRWQRAAEVVQISLLLMCLGCVVLALRQYSASTVLTSSVGKTAPSERESLSSILGLGPGGRKAMDLLIAAKEKNLHAEATALRLKKERQTLMHEQQSAKTKTEAEAESPPASSPVPSSPVLSSALAAAARATEVQILLLFDFCVYWFNTSSCLDFFSQSYCC